MAILPKNRVALPAGGGILGYSGLLGTPSLAGLNPIKWNKVYILSPESRFETRCTTRVHPVPPCTTLYTPGTPAHRWSSSGRYTCSVLVAVSEREVLGSEASSSLGRRLPWVTLPRVVTGSSRVETGLRKTRKDKERIRLDRIG